MTTPPPENDLGDRTARNLVRNMRHGMLAVWIIAALVTIAAIMLIVWPFL
ncbi:MAG: hypothetical protein M3Q65_18895 [Chloroflexota bacterium]|nr:hypothetical protein [Chloroflexota bacterium]